MTPPKIKEGTKVFYIGTPPSLKILEENAERYFRGIKYLTVLKVKEYSGDVRYWLEFEETGKERQWPHTMFAIYKEVDNPPKKKDNKDKGWGF